MKFVADRHIFHLWSIDENHTKWWYRSTVLPVIRGCSGDETALNVKSEIQ